jgi:hypothetical protein
MFLGIGISQPHQCKSGVSRQQEGKEGDEDIKRKEKREERELKKNGKTERQ